MVPQSLKDAPRVLEGARFDVCRLDVPGRDGGTVRREVCVAPDAVVILPLLADGRVVLIRNERFAVDETLWELPAGTLETGEEPIAAARREVEEETGYQAGQVEPLLAFYPSPGICTERMHAFLAGDLSHVGQQLDANERITVEVATFERTMQMIGSGDIRDGKTIATLLYYQCFRTGRR